MHGFACHAAQVLLGGIEFFTHLISHLFLWCLFNNFVIHKLPPYVPIYFSSSSKSVSCYYSFSKVLFLIAMFIFSVGLACFQR